MAFIATIKGNDNKPETLAVIRAVSDADNNKAEIAIIVRTDMQGHGIGNKLMDKIIQYCRARGTKCLTGQVLLENEAMIHLAKKFNFEVKALTEQGIVEISLGL